MYKLTKIRECVVVSLLRWRALLGLACIVGILASCAAPAPAPRDSSARHISSEVPEPVMPTLNIPEPVVQTPVLPPPTPATPIETYTVVVNEVPVKELLFALARDAVVNVDIHPSIEGSVTLNAINQSLNQILDRIARQIDLRYELIEGVLVIAPDTPFLKSYQIDYLNMARDSNSEIKTSTEVATTAGGGGDGSASGNTSDTSVSNISNHRIWETLSTNIVALLGEEAPGTEGGIAQTSEVIVNPEGGVITVRATAKQHIEVQKYIDLVMTNVRRQVLIEATIVEVLLDDQYQGGVDWSRLAAGAGFQVAQTLLGGFAGAAAGVSTGLVLNYSDTDQQVDITLRLLQEFGETRVLSSPKLMTLNNQTAILKVVDNEVYFTLELQEDQNELGTDDRTLTSTVNTVAVGVIMNVTPQINAYDDVTLNIRPTISRIREFVSDPAVQIIAAKFGVEGAAIESLVPVVQVRETETTLKVGSGQIAVLGGLMQDTNVRDTDQVPGLADLEVIGEAFQFNERNYKKSELVIFMRPWVVRNPDVLYGDLNSFEPMLPENQEYHEPLKTLSPQLLGE